MSEKNSNTMGFLPAPKDWLAAQQNFLPSGILFERMGEATRILTRAQMAYGQAVMQANAAMFGAFLQSGGAAEGEIGPSAAAKQPDYAGT